MINSWSVSCDPPQLLESIIEFVTFTASFIEIGWRNVIFLHYLTILSIWGQNLPRQEIEMHEIQHLSISAVEQHELGWRWCWCCATATTTTTSTSPAATAPSSSMSLVLLLCNTDNNNINISRSSYGTKQQQVHHRRYENPGMRELTFLARKSGIFIMHHSPTMRPFRSLPLFSI